MKAYQAPVAIEVVLPSALRAECLPR